MAEPMGTEPWSVRARRADTVAKTYDAYLAEVQPQSDAEARAFLAGVNPQEKVNSKHHVVPKFMLRRWADGAGQVQVYSRVDKAISTRHINDLGYTGFYTVIRKDGEKDSSVESILSQVEGTAATAFDDLLNRFIPTAGLVHHLGPLAQFTSFQIVRTPRHRREYELQAEWYVKTMARGRVSEDELRSLTIRPHQNDAIKTMAETVPHIFPLLACRPLALIRLSAPLLYVGDEAVIVNAHDDPAHLPDCFLSDEEVHARMKRRRRKDRRRLPRGQYGGRMVHMHSGGSAGIGVALEIVMPISPSAALVWGPLQDLPYQGPIDELFLDDEEGSVFAEKVNEAICRNALDWIITRPGDTTLQTRRMPETGPLLRICDGANAAADAINTAPTQIRPARLWVPKD